MSRTKLPFKEFVWSPKLAYAVGLLVTDGNLSKDGRHVNMRSSDMELLRTFRSCLKLKNNKIGISHNDGYATRPSYRIQFSNVQFYRWLLSIGVNPAKTYTIGAIKIPNTFFRDFLRGHLDGDGTILTYVDKYNIYKNKRYVNTRIYTKFISASENHIRWLYEMISINSPATGVVLHTKPQSDRVVMWTIKFSKYDSLRLLRWLYYKKNLPSLSRKRKIAEQLLRRVVNNKLVR